MAQQIDNDCKHSRNCPECNNSDITIEDLVDEANKFFLNHSVIYL